MHYRLSTTDYRLPTTDCEAIVAGYSGTPLAKKLGIKPRGRVHVVSPPSNYRSLLAPLPANVKFVRRLDPTVDILHVFATREGELRAFLQTAIRAIRPDAA